MEEIRIKELGDIYTGKTPPTANPKNFGNTYPFVTPVDLTDDKFIKDTERFVSTTGIKHTTLIPTNSICVSCIGYIGKIGITQTNSCTNQQINSIIVNENYNIDYVYYLLNFNVPYFKELAGVNVVPQLNKRDFSKVKLLATKNKPEQTAIATILSKVDEAIEATRQSIKVAEKLKKALMQNLLTGKLKPDGTWRTDDEFQKTKIGLIPKDWDVKSVKELSTQVTDGEHTTPTRSESGYYLLSARNIKNSYLDLSNVDYVEEKELLRIQKRCNPQEGDILISCSGTIGNVCVVPKGLNAGMVRSAALVKLKKDKIEPMFAELVFQSFSLQNQMKVSVASSVQGNIFQGAIKKLRIAYPANKSERDGITDMVNSLSTEMSSKQTKIKTLQRLKKSLMQNLLTGKVRLNPAIINDKLLMMNEKELTINNSPLTINKEQDNG